MARHVIGTVEEMPPGTRRRVEVDGRGIAVFNTGGRFYAIRDACPHMGAHLSAGTVWSTLTATEVGCYEFHGEQKSVRCPWHGWEYDLETGRSWYDPERDRVRAYAIAVEHGAELLEAGPDGRVEGPYTAETFQVTVDNDYVVIEV